MRISLGSIFLIIVIVAVFGGGGRYYNNGAYQGASWGIGTVLLVLAVLWICGVL